jgi:uncharacterized damage-inducible protein DinB
MTELERLEDQLRLSFEGEAWHGPSVEEALRGVTEAHAAQHPIKGAHSIWELVLHLAATYRVVLRRIDRDGRPMTREEDWPPVPEPTAANWNAAVDALRKVNADIRAAVRRFDPAALDQPLVRHPTYTAYVQFIGITQHDLYHAGQIVLIKRALGA